MSISQPPNHLRDESYLSDATICVDGLPSTDSSIARLKESQSSDISDATARTPPTPPVERPINELCPHSVIPLDDDRRKRTLVLCFDGTGDQFDSDNSNIVQFFSMLHKGDKHKQKVYYQSGIGTYCSPQIATPLGSKVSQTLDAMLAWNLDAHVMDGYEFLMQNYDAGDRICIFGFSRGAYTARSLAGMIHKVGLLPADNWQQVPFAYKMYTRADEVGWAQSNAFKKAFSIDVDIEFIGVWDTVSSVGLIPRMLPFTTSNTIVRTFRHAVALDERRGKFKANLWNHPTPAELSQMNAGKPVYQPHIPTNQSGTPKPQVNVDIIEAKPSNGSALEDEKGETRHSTSPHGHYERPKLNAVKSEENLSRLELQNSQHRSRPTDVQEVWFAGCHCDVGGGSVPNNTPNSLARISLRWMIRECFKVKTGILFESERLKEIGLSPNTLYPDVLQRPSPKQSCDQFLEPIPPRPSWTEAIWYPLKMAVQGVMQKLSGKNRNHEIGPAQRQGSLPWSMRDKPHIPTGTEEDEELKDALSPIYDQLKLKYRWWVLEYIPMQYREQDETNEWKYWYGCNKARPRSIPKRSVKIHRSVKMRMDAMRDNRGKCYEIKAQHDDVELTWVD